MALTAATDYARLRDDPGQNPLVGRLLARLGRLEAARAVDVSATNAPPQFLAAYHFALGDEDRGFEDLTRMFEARAGGALSIRLWPIIDDVRDDPRFVALIARLELPGAP